jgi:hypothetical protein
MTTNRTNGKPRRPRGRQSNFRTPEESAQFRAYIERLRQWLDSLSDEEHDRALKRLTREELEYITALITYENYQKGGPLRELLEGTVIEGAL